MACSVCLEPLDFHSSADIVGLPCTHVFHGRCVAVYYDRSGCPKCRHKSPDGAASFLKLHFDVDDGSSTSNKPRDSFVADLLNALDQSKATNDELVTAQANKTYQGNGSDSRIKIWRFTYAGIGLSIHLNPSCPQTIKSAGLFSGLNVSKATFQVEFHDVESIGRNTLSSSICYVRGIPWTLDIYREKRHKVWWLGAYLSCELEPNWCCRARGSIELVARADDDDDDDGEDGEEDQVNGEDHADDEEASNIKEDLKDSLFNEESNSWGTSLIRWHRACDPGEGFLKDGALLFNVTIDADAPTVKFRYVMDDFRSLRNAPRFSPVHHFLGVPWQIRIEREKSDDGTWYLGFYLHCAINNAASWSCRARANLRIVAQFDFAADIEADIEHRFSSTWRTCGFTRFAAWGQICNAKVGHIKDDTVIFEVSLSADPAFGI